MYFPTADDAPPSPFRTPAFTTSFARLTSIARNLLSDEGWILPFQLRVTNALASAAVRPLPQTVCSSLIFLKIYF
jgi:hypothetical protein